MSQHLSENLPVSSMTALRASEADTPQKAKWWKEAVVYQVYTRSFSDSNGDGIGDLPGLIDRLDYLQSLGVQVIWLAPHYDTPNVDNGYDIRDYRAVDPLQGTMADFDRLVAGLHERGMKLIVDLVINHTSDQHEWFRQSRSGPDNPYRDFYIWRDGRDDGPPNNYLSIFGGSAWEKDEASGQYYLHYFAKEQPDLNWENPKVRQEVYNMMRFWLDKGVSGFRMDSICFISKLPGLRDLTLAEMESLEHVYVTGPKIHDYLQDMHHEVLVDRDLLTVGEAFGVSFEDTPAFVSEARNELTMVFHFEIVRIGRHDWQVQDWTIKDLKAVLRGEETSSGPDGWLTSFLENHDNPRSVSWFGDPSPKGHGPSAKALATLLIMRRGTPYIYQGEEIGMTNIHFDGIEDFQDINAKGIWNNTVGIGKMSAEEVLHSLRRVTRDNARTPMQWDASNHAGFTTGLPWFRVNPNHIDINVAQQDADPNSILNYYRTLIQLRASQKTLIYGDFEDVDPDHPAVIAFTRTLGDDQFLILINMCGETEHYILPHGLKIAEVLLDNMSASVENVLPNLKPWQAGIYRLAPPADI
ncbi:glycoside hydrolase family 13 protein [Gluconobacter frateurii]|uniref:Sucrose isomerase n=1 Tax=Gluconobacter frateurii NRIC 0228 TaxID=1307946 RepID=A0ABQ0Q8J0_9PROT|nr:alpha-glucosidase [Gluconobacter frateurii]GBR09019.1 sucrose isomerase [Gluconobacter frateurii NRIC 0228]GLP90896.1 alpha-glucosidase [Gluconobacter frateurii]